MPDLFQHILNTIKKPRDFIATSCIDWWSKTPKLDSLRESDLPPLRKGGQGVSVMARGSCPHFVGTSGHAPSHTLGN